MTLTAPGFDTPFDRALDLQLVRDIPISPEQAFEGWTVPATLMQWFCPKPWQVVDCDIDLRPGGDQAGKIAHEMMGLEAGWGAALGQLVALMQARPS